MDLPLATPELDHDALRLNLFFRTEIDRDEGYSPSPDSVSISRDQNTLFSQFFLEPESSVSRLCTLRRSSSLTPTPSFLSFSARLCVAQFPVRGQVWKPYRWVVCPIPSLTLEEVFPPTSLTVIHSWVRGLF
jgi:hypothetical protein